MIQLEIYSKKFFLGVKYFIKFFIESKYLYFFIEIKFSILSNSLNVSTYTEFMINNHKYCIYCN